MSRCLELFKSWGFRSFGEQVKVLAGRATAVAAAPAPSGSVQRELFPTEDETFPFGANAPNSDGAAEPGAVSAAA